MEQKPKATQLSMRADQPHVAHNIDIVCAIPLYLRAVSFIHCAASETCVGMYDTLYVCSFCWETPAV